MTLNFNNLIGKLAVGSSSATKAYLGSQAVWTAGTPASLLLRFDGNFNDSSPSPLTVTETAGTLIRSTQSKFGGSSAYFDGSVLGYLRVASDSSLNLTGEIPYTIEFWMWMESYSNDYTSILTRRVGANWQYILGFSDPTNRRLYFSATSQGGGQYSQCYSQQEIPLQQWVHIAACVSCGTAKLFIDGKLVDTQPWAIQPDNEANLWVAQQGSGGEFFNGYIDDLRIVKGLAVYDGPFDPPSSPLSAYASTVPVSKSASLLLHFDGNLTDSSPNGLTVTAVGGAATSTAQSKFGGASAAFNGSGQRLDIPTGGNLAFGTDDFTVELWAYFGAGSNNVEHVLFSQASPTDAVGAALAIYQNDLMWLIGDGGGSWLFQRYAGGGHFSAGSVVAGQWNHLAITRSGSTFRLFANGVIVDTYTSTASLPDTNSLANVGGRSNFGQFFNGYIDDVRITKGLAVYKGPFTPPTAPLTAVATPQPVNASLVLNFDGNFTDESVNGLTVTPVGGAAISTSVKKFGSGSLALDGVDDYVTAAGIDFNASSGDWTIEAWVWLNSLEATFPIVVGVPRNFYYEYVYDGTDFLLIAGDASVNPIFATRTGLTPAAGAWWHVALVKKGGTCTAFENGQQVATTTGGFANIELDDMNVGADAALTPPLFAAGYIDGLRITKAALYCSNFCVPTSPPTPTATVQQCVSTPTTTTPPPVFGCTDPGAINYNSEANSDDGSCCYDNYSNIQFLNCTGCDLADFDINDSCGNYLRTENLSASAYGHDCSTAGCIDPASLNHNPNALCDDGNCCYDDYTVVEFIGCTGCNLADFNIFDSCANYLRTENLSSLPYGYDCSAGGCTDPNALNYDGAALCDDGTCSYE